MSGSCPISVLIPTKNEERNLKGCLDSIWGWADEIVLVDSQSTDCTVDIAGTYNLTVLQFEYNGGWPKKRQWALENHDWNNDWILLLDADEILLPDIKKEIASAIERPDYDGYLIRFQVHFLGQMLRYGGTQLWKLSLFRKGKARYELRLRDQDISMGDMEVHEHVVVEGRTGRLRNPVKHENLNNLSHYIIKHNDYSNWEARLLFDGNAGEIEPALWGTQAQRRRWLKKYFFKLPGAPLAFFIVRYFFLGGFLDGVPGLMFCSLQAIHFFNVKLKLYELKRLGLGRGDKSSLSMSSSSRLKMD